MSSDDWRFQGHTANVSHYYEHAYLAARCLNDMDPEGHFLQLEIAAAAMQTAQFAPGACDPATWAERLDTSLRLAEPAYIGLGQFGEVMRPKAVAALYNPSATAPQLVRPTRLIAP